MSKPEPVAWIGPIWQTMPHDIYEAWRAKYPDDAAHFRPLYDQAAIDAAVAAKRERCAKLCDEAARNNTQTTARLRWPLEALAAQIRSADEGPNAELTGHRSG
jgi:hypothetical protein